jgi:hypothetical protein
MCVMYVTCVGWGEDIFSCTYNTYVGTIMEIMKNRKIHFLRASIRCGSAVK